MSRTDSQTLVFPRSGSPTKDDLRPNPHPYAIQTSVLSRSNSSLKHRSHSSTNHHYVPSLPPSPTHSKSTSGGRHVSGHRHRYSRSLSSDEAPRPLPIPPSMETSDIQYPKVPIISTPRRSKRADTLPTPPHTAPSALTPSEDLPPNPKLWTPSQLATYLTTALRVRSDESVQLPAPVAKDIAAFVRSSRITGRSFLRFKEEDLESYGLNKLWRSALLSASRTLRHNVLKGRIWGFDNSPDESSHSTLSDEDEDATPPTRRSKMKSDDNPFTNGTVVYSSASSSSSMEDLNESPLSQWRRFGSSALGGRYTGGRVKGMVASFERSSSFNEDDEARPSLQRSGSPGDSDSEVFESAIEDARAEDIYATQRPASRPLPTPPANASIVSAFQPLPEPSMEELLASEDNLYRAQKSPVYLDTVRHIAQPQPTRAGVHAWEADDSSFGLVTMKRLPNMPGSDSAGDSHGPKIDTVFSGNIEVATPQQDTIANSVEVGTNTEEEDTSLSTAEETSRLESEIEETRKMLRDLGVKLKDVEQKISAMEEAQIPHDTADHHDKVVDTTDLPNQPTPISRTFGFLFDRGTVWGRLMERVFGLPLVLPQTFYSAQRRITTQNYIERILDPSSISALPSYLLLVGLGVCAVVLRVVLKRALTIGRSK